MATRPFSVQRRIYRLSLLFYPPSFRREYGGLMTQAFTDRLRDDGPVRTWLLIAGDLFVSIPEQILEATMLSQKLLALLIVLSAAVGAGAIVFGAGPPILFVFGMMTAAVLAFVWARRRSNAPTELLYGGAAPKRWTWWTVLAVLFAVVYVLNGIGMLIDDPKPENVFALALSIALAAMIFFGLRLRSQARVGGNVMVIIAAVPGLSVFWLIFPTVVGLAIILGASIEIARAAPRAPMPT